MCWGLGGRGWSGHIDFFLPLSFEKSDGIMDSFQLCVCVYILGVGFFFLCRN